MVPASKVVWGAKILWHANANKKSHNNVNESFPNILKIIAIIPKNQKIIKLI